MKHLLNGATVLNLGWEWNINEGCGGTCKNNVGTYMDGRSRLASVLGRASALSASSGPGQPPPADVYLGGAETALS